MSLRGNLVLFNKINKIRCITPIRTIVDKINDTETHTGQKWDADDYRMARFTLAPKQVNPNWAIKLIDEVPPQVTDKRVVWCDGGDGPEGHPRVYINLDKPGNHACGYCGLRFVKKDMEWDPEKDKKGLITTSSLKNIKF